VIAYVDGKFQDPREATIPFLDRGFLFGDGIYETLRTYNRRPHRVELHLERFRRSASALAIPFQVSDDELTRIILEGIASVAAPSEVVARIWITRGPGLAEYDPGAGPCDPRLYALFRSLTPPPESIYLDGVDAGTLREDKPHALYQVKTTAAVPQILALMRARNKDLFEVIRVNNLGDVTEGSRSNLFMVREGQVITPRLSDGLLDGITRRLVVETLSSQDRTVEEATVPLDALMQADEVFLTRTTVGVVPVVRIDDTTIGTGRPGPITTNLIEVFKSWGRET